MTKFRATNDRESHVKNEELFQQPMREGAKKSRGLLTATTRKRAKLLMLRETLTSTVAATKEEESEDDNQ